MRRRVCATLVASVIAASLLFTGSVAVGDTSESVLTPEAWGPVEGAWGANVLEEYGLVTFVHAVQVDAALDYMVSIEVARQAAIAAAAARAVRPRVSSGGGGGSCDRPAQGGGNWQSNPNGQFVGGESGGNYGACNESSGACGAYQFLDSTWAGYGGYRSACDAPPAVQDEKAATLPPCHWQPPNFCA